MAPSPILIDVWTVEHERQDALVQAISANLQRLVVNRPGFVSADIYQSSNGGMVLLKVLMRTVKDRQALTDAPELAQALRELRGIASSHTHFYRLAESFSAQPPGPAE